MSAVVRVYGKAIVGALVAGLGALGVALEDGAVSGQEGTVIAVAFLVALGAVWGAPYAPATRDDGHDPNLRA